MMITPTTSSAGYTSEASSFLRTAEATRWKAMYRLSTSSRLPLFSPASSVVV